MECGNETYESLRGQFPINDRAAYAAALEPLFTALDCDGYGMDVENEVFTMRPHCWCDEATCPQCGTADHANFHYKPTKFKLTWYKYAMRDAYMSAPLTPDQLREVALKCVASLPLTSD